MSAFVYDPVAGNIKSYLNGVLNSTVGQGALNISGTGFRLSSGGTGLGLGETMDEFRVYGRALSAQELLATYNSQLPLVSTPNEAGICGFITPTLPSCSLGSGPVEVCISTLSNTALTSVGIVLEINGVVQSTFNWTGNLLQYQKDTVNIGTYTINSGDNLRVWTSLPNGQTEPAAVAYNDTASLLVKAGISGNYTVGGATADYADFSSAIADLNTFGICGPVTLTAKSGSGPFSEKFEIGEVTGASSTNTITINGNGEKIIFDGNTGQRPCILLNGADWVTVTNFDLDASSAAAGFGILLTAGADNNTISNNTVRLNTTSTSSVFAGIGLSNSTTSFTSTGGNSGNNNTFINNNVIGGYYAFSAAGQNSSTYCTGNRFVNNIASDFYFYGIYSYYQDQIDLIGNNFTKRTSSPSTVSGYGIYAIYNAHFNFSNNKLISWGTYGIYLSTVNLLSNSVNDRSLVANNFIANNGQITTNYGIYLTSTSSRSVDLYHNSIYLSGGSNGRGIYVAGSATAYPANIVNNAIEVDGSSGYALYVSSTNYVNTINYNGYHAPNSSNFVYIAGSYDVNDFIGGGGYNANSVEGSAEFLAPDDLHSLSGVLESAGITIPGLDTDIDGDKRCPAATCPGGGTAPDIGADEYLLPPEDATVSNISRESICGGTNDVLVDVGNFGFKVMRTVTVFATVNGTHLPNSGRKFTLTPPVSSGMTQTVNLGAYTFVDGQNYTITAWTSAPNSRPDANINNDTLTINGEPALSGTFSVGSGGDYATMAAAISDLNSRGVCGPVVFEVVAGTYTNSEFTINEFSGSSATNTVTIRPKSGTVVFQNDPSSTTDNHIFQFNGADWVTLKDLTLHITDPSSYGTRIDILGQCDGLTIEGCTLLANTSLLSSSTNIAAVYLSSSANDIVTNFTFKNNIIDNASAGLYLYGSTSGLNNNVLIEGNTLTNIKYYGMYLGYCDEYKVNNNYIEKVPYSTTYGIYTFNSTANTVQCEMVGNKLVLYGTTTMYGMYFSSIINRTPGLIANNMVSLLDNPNSSTTYGMYFTTCANLNIYHNSVYLNSGSATAGRGIYLAGTSTLITGMRLINNCSYNAGGGLAIEIASSSPVQSMNFNNWYSSGPNLGEYANVGYSDMTSWRAASGFDGISVSVDPKYNDANDLHANAIGINNRGLSGIMPTDIDGEVRCPAPGCPGGTFAPDLGADEFEIPPIDITPGKVVSPAEDGFGCNQNPNTPVVVEVLNNGSQPLNFAANPATVSWTAGSQSGSAVFNTGSIPVGGSMNVTVGTINLSAAGQYTFDLTATVQGDMKTSNDIAEDAGTVISRDPINVFPYLEDFNSFPTCAASGTTPCDLPFSSGWTNETNDGHDWIVYSGDAPGTTTGPSGDFDGNGNYLYLEYLANSTAVLTSPCIDLPTNPGACPFVTFAYHMYVNGTTSFEVQVSDGGPWKTEFFASGPQAAFNSPDSPWKLAVIDVSKYSGTIRVRFIGNVTTNTLCDVAIDNFAMVDGKFAADFEINAETSDACTVFELVNKTAIPMTASQWSMPGTPGMDYEFVNGTTDRSLVANVRFFRPGQKTIHLLATTVCGRSSQTQTINVTPGVAKLELDVNQTSGTAWCTIFEFSDDSPLATTDWTWGVRKADGTTGRVGVDYGFVTGDRRAHEVDLMFYKTGYFDVEFYANAGCDSSKTVVVKRIEILPEDPAPTTTDDNLSGPGIATLTATGQQAGSTIEWFDKERNGTLLHSGSTFNPSVSRTTTFWAREALDIQGDLVSTMAGGNGQSGNMWDVKNETGSVMKITDINVHIGTSSTQQIRIFYKVGTYVGFEGNASAWTEIANMVVNSNGIGNETPVTLHTQPDLLPGGTYAFYAILPSSTDIDYTNGTTEGAVQSTDGNLTIYQGIGVTAPEFSTSSRFAPRVWNGRMTYKIGGCPSEPAPATAYVGNVPPLSILPANGNDRRTADWSVVEGPWTHYYNNNGTPANIADDYRLLSLRLGGQNIGSIGDGTFRVEMASTANAGTGFAVDLSSTAGYLGPNQGALSMNRYWNVTATNQPSQPVGVRFYYNDADVVDLNATLIHDLNENPVDHTQLAFNKIATNENPDPTANGHATVDPGEYINIVHANIPTTSTWVHGTLSDFHYAEFEVNSFSGGTGGVAHGLTSGSLPVELVDFEVSQVANTALLEWTSATEINTEVYEIERSVDGAVFEVIGEKEAAGNSQQAISYTFTDGKPLEGRNYYRLRMVDADGSFGYSEVRTLTFEAKALTLAAYPNPFSSDFMVTFTTEQKGAAQISIFDAAGKQIHSQQIEKVVPGVNTTKIVPASNLAQGLYIMTLTQNGVSQRLQLVKQ